MDVRASLLVHHCAVLNGTVTVLNGQIRVTDRYGGLNRYANLIVHRRLGKALARQT